MNANNEKKNEVKKTPKKKKKLFGLMSKKGKSIFS
jgi:hypothetical protein